MNKPAVLRLENIVRTYTQADRVLQVLKGLNLSVHAGEIVALVGPSGSGKSSLLHICGLLEPPTSGDLFIADEKISDHADKTRTILRRHKIGYVYQAHHLLPDFTALENVALPHMVAGITQKDADQKAKKYLTAVGLAQRFHHYPSQLSGGEQQRTAIARALINDPLLLLADEPTGNLDPQTAEDVFQLLLETVRQTGMAAVIATHNLELAKRMDRIIEIRNGFLVEQ
jgi:lipoprotein-releasing system ATP-binding protein